MIFKLNDLMLRSCVVFYSICIGCVAKFDWFNVLGFCFYLVI